MLKYAHTETGRAGAPAQVILTDRCNVKGNTDISAGDVPVHWVIQENQGDSATVRRLVGAIEENRQIAIW